MIYKGTDYLIESLEIILYDEIPYLCESYNQMPICKLPKKVIKYLSLLNMYYYGFTILNNDFFTFCRSLRFNIIPSLLFLTISLMPPSEIDKVGIP